MCVLNTKKLITYKNESWTLTPQTQIIDEKSRYPYVCDCLPLLLLKVIVNTHTHIHDTLKTTQ